DSCPRGRPTSARPPCRPIDVADPPGQNADDHAGRSSLPVIVVTPRGGVESRNADAVLPRPRASCPHLGRTAHGGSLLRLCLRRDGPDPRGERTTAAPCSPRHGLRAPRRRLLHPGHALRVRTQNRDRLQRELQDLRLPKRIEMGGRQFVRRSCEDRPGKAMAVTLRRHVVESWQVPGRFWDQSWSYRTTVEEVSLLPRWGLLDASHEGLREIDPEPLRNHEDYDAYLGGLEEYLNVWIGRIGTILSEDSLRVQLELTGGKDSRGVLALFLAARQYFGVDLGQHVNFMSSQAAGKGADLAVAKELAAAYGLPLNRKKFTQGPATHLTAPQQISWWGSFAFGSYRPIYLVSPRRHLATLPFGGQGGEGTRQQYEPFPDLAALLDHNAKHFRSRESFEAAVADVEESIARIRAWTPRLPELLAHYQEFRDRFHSGLHPQTRPRVVPLTGRHLHAAA